MAIFSWHIKCLHGIFSGLHKWIPNTWQEFAWMCNGIPLTTKLQWLFCSITNFLELQETKVEIGTVVDVHSSGASDLLRVQLKSSNKGKDVRIWIPFVKDIVPTVDNESKRIEIRPPEGLLELNVPKEGLTRKDIRKQVGLLLYILCDVFRSNI